MSYYCWNKVSNVFTVNGVWRFEKYKYHLSVDNNSKPDLDCLGTAPNSIQCPSSALLAEPSLLFFFCCGRACLPALWRNFPFSALHQHSKQNPHCCFSFVVAGHVQLLCGGTFPFKSKVLGASHYQTNTWVLFLMSRDCYCKDSACRCGY